MRRFGVEDPDLSDTLSEFRKLTAATPKERVPGTDPGMRSGTPAPPAHLNQELISRGQSLPGNPRDSTRKAAQQEQSRNSEGVTGGDEESTLAGKKGRKCEFLL